MKCPRDGTRLQEVSIADITLDKCHLCDGIWCDEGELDQLRQSKIEKIEAVLEKKYGNPAFRSGTSDGYMECPRCEDGQLHGMTCSWSSPVRVDRCNKCLGVWLDETELEAIIRDDNIFQEAMSDLEAQGTTGQKPDDSQLPGRFRALMSAIVRSLGTK